MNFEQSVPCRLGILLAISAILAGCVNKAQPSFERPPAPVVVSTAVSQDVSTYMDALGKISALTIGTLMITTAIAAAIGILMAKVYGLSAVGLTSSAAEVARGHYLEGKLSTAQQLSLPNMILSFIPENPFLDMTGTRSTSTLRRVTFTVSIAMPSASERGRITPLPANPT